MKMRAMRAVSGALAMLAAGAAPLAAHGGHAEAAGGVLHVVLHLLASPVAWATGAAAMAVALFVRRVQPAPRPVHGTRER